jgi:hypothetical protein
LIEGTVKEGTTENNVISEEGSSEARSPTVGHDQDNFSDGFNQKDFHITNSKINK